MVVVCTSKSTLRVAVVIPVNEGKVSSAADVFFTHIQNKANGNLIYRHFSQK